MSPKENGVAVTETMIILLVFLNALILKFAFISNENWYWSLIITLPLLLVIIVDIHQKKHNIVRRPGRKD
jgi:hypothetical protein